MPAARSLASSARRWSRSSTPSRIPRPARSRRAGCGRSRAPRRETRDMTAVSRSERRIELLTRSGCSLCTTARESVRRIAAEAGVGWRERDVDEDPDLADEYGDRVPVVLLDGAEHAYWRGGGERLGGAPARGRPDLGVAG